MSAARIVAAEPGVGADPDHAVGGFGESAHPQRLAGLRELARQRDAHDVEIRGGEAVETVRRPDQRVAVAKMNETEEGIAGKRGGIRHRMTQPGELAAAGIEQREARVARGDPHPSEPVACKRAHALQVRGVAQCGGLFERASRGVAEDDAAAIGGDPQTVLTRDQRRDPAIGQRVVVATVVAQLTEFVSVEAIESVLGAEPHEPFGVLDDRVHGLL
jgi:hypothetical protein